MTIDKTLVIRRLLKNRMRFKAYTIINKEVAIFTLDRSCLCGLSNGDRFQSKSLQAQVIEVSGTYLVAVCKK